jgi:hypothetical protein
MSKEKPIGDVARAIINLSLNLAESQVKNRVTDETLLKGVNTALPLIREIVEELNDDNPDNAKQIKETLLAWTNEPLADYLETVLAELESKLENPNERLLVGFFGRKCHRNFATDDRPGAGQRGADSQLLEG